MPPKSKFEVLFHTGEVEEVYAFSKTEARILAQASQISKGHSFKVKSIKKFESRFSARY